jgi:lipoprotein signal peptidase
VEPILKNILGSNSWPSFNIADAAIVIGMIMFGIHYVFLEKDEEAEPDPPAETLPDIISK